MNESSFELDNMNKLLKLEKIWQNIRPVYIIFMKNFLNVHLVTMIGICLATSSRGSSLFFVKDIIIAPSIIV